jgi:hypothetical protein
MNINELKGFTPGPLDGFKQLVNTTVGGFWIIGQAGQPPTAYVSNAADAELYRQSPRLLELAHLGLELASVVQEVMDNEIHRFSDNNGWTPTLSVSMYERLRDKAATLREKAGVK